MEKVKFILWERCEKCVCVSEVEALDHVTCNMCGDGRKARRLVFYAGSILERTCVDNLCREF